METQAPTKTRGPGRPPGGEAVTRATRASIVDAAFRVFSENGYASASLREIARQCGVSHATLLHHFPRKADLLTATLERRDLQFPEIAESTPVDVLLADMVEGARRNENQPGIVHVFTVVAAEAADPDHPAHAYFERRTTQFIASVAACLRHGQENGTVPTHWSAESMATNIIALWDGLQLHVPLNPAPVSIADQLQLSFEAMLGRPIRPAQNS